MKLSNNTATTVINYFNKVNIADGAGTKMLDAMFADGIRANMLIQKIGDKENPAYDADLAESITLAYVASQHFGADRRALISADIDGLPTASKVKRREAMMRKSTGLNNVRKLLARREEDLEKRARRAKLDKKLASLKTKKGKENAIAKFNEAEKKASKKTRAPRTPSNPRKDFIEHLTTAWRLAKKLEEITEQDRETINALIAKLEG